MFENEILQDVINGIKDKLNVDSVLICSVIELPCLSYHDALKIGLNKCIKCSGCIHPEEHNIHFKDSKCT